MSFFIGVLFCVIVITIFILGMGFGGKLAFQMAVDRTKRGSFFNAYDKKWKVVEVQGGEHEEETRS